MEKAQTSSESNKNGAALLLMLRHFL